MYRSRIPLLAARNGPSYLLHTVETLHALRVPHANIRLVPVIGRCGDTEVEPYDPSGLAQSAPFDPRRFRARLGINVRDDSRLRRFLPLAAIGMAPLSEVAAWRERGDKASAAYHDLYHSKNPDDPGNPYDPYGPDNRMNRIAPDWTNNETPAERLTRQLCLRFPEMRDLSARLEANSDRVLTATSIRAGHWQDRLNAYATTQPQSMRRIENDAPYLTVQSLVELFFTQAMLLIATADMMGGFGYELPIEPQGRAIGVSIAADADLREVTRWLHAYPHLPLLFPHYPKLAAREQAEWEEYFAPHPGHDNVFETARKLWTEEDPAIIAFFGDIRAQYDRGRSEALTSDEMLSLARKHLPGYVPAYPRQFAVTGGMNLEGMLVSLMETWLAKGPFLGITYADWNLFAPEQQMVLCGLLMQRRSMLDQCALFQTAACLLVDPGIETTLEMFRLEPVRLGKPLAQMNRTLSLKGAVALHAPEMIVKIPLDRERDPQSHSVEQKLKVITRLFLPIHIVLKTIWRIDRPILGKSTYLRRGSRPDQTGPATRLG